MRKPYRYKSDTIDRSDEGESHYMDLFSRKIIAWTLSRTLEVSCVIETINKAKSRRKTTQPLIIHSDCESQYVSKEYRKVTESM